MTLKLVKYRPKEPTLPGSPDRQVRSLEDIRRKLLQKNDWANLSTSRPLNVHFTTEEERYNYGRRRPLTKADQERLAAPEKRRAPMIQRRDWSLKRLKRREAGDDTSTLPNIDDISIRINEQKLPWLSSRLPSESHVPSQVSSELMLLDQEEEGEDRVANVSSVFGNPRKSKRTDVFAYSSTEPIPTDELKMTTFSGTPQFPILNRCGSFARDGYTTSYIPPRVEDASSSSVVPSSVELPPNALHIGRELRTMRPQGNHQRALRETLVRPLEGTPPAIATGKPRRIFFGQPVDESANDFPDEDEIWKRLVFRPRKHASEIDEKPETRLFVRKETATRRDTSSIPEVREFEPGGNPDAGSNYSPTNSGTFQTAANTSLNWAPSFKEDSIDCSETDFLSQYSPMEGCIDEFLSDISMHNNATKSNPSDQLSSPVATFQKQTSPQETNNAGEPSCIDPKWLRPRFYPAESSSGPLSLRVNDAATESSFFSNSNC